jgi:hypothetical protein
MQNKENKAESRRIMIVTTIRRRRMEKRGSRYETVVAFFNVKSRNLPEETE